MTCRPSESDTWMPAPSAPPAHNPNDVFNQPYAVFGSEYEEINQKIKAVFEGVSKLIGEPATHRSSSSSLSSPLIYSPTWSPTWIDFSTHHHHSDRTKIKNNSKTVDPVTVICGLATLALGFYCSGKQDGRTNSYDHYIGELNKIDQRNRIYLENHSGQYFVTSASADNLSVQIREVLEIKQKQNRDWKQMSFTTILTGAGLVGGAVLQAQGLLIAACACGVFTLFRSLYLHAKSASIQLDVQYGLTSIQKYINKFG